MPAAVQAGTDDLDNQDPLAVFDDLEPVEPGPKRSWPLAEQPLNAMPGRAPIAASTEGDQTTGFVKDRLYG